MRLYTLSTYWTDVKFLYCPKCKEIRAKTWFQRRNRCLACIGPATLIVVPNGYLTYLNYVLYILAPMFAIISVLTDTRDYIWVAVGLLIVMMISSYLDLVRGEKIARKKVKIGTTSLHEFRRRGWT